MKYLKFLFVLLLFSCSKEESPVIVEQSIYLNYVHTSDRNFEISNRDGSYSPVFYLNSVTTDNFTLPGLPRTQISYNRSKIDSVYLYRLNLNTVNLNGVLNGFYNLSVHYLDGTKEGGDVMANSSIGNYYAYKPSSVSLFPSNDYKKIIMVKNSDKQDYYDYRTGSMRVRWKYSFYQVTTSGSDFVPGWPGSIFLFPHN